MTKILLTIMLIFSNMYACGCLDPINAENGRETIANGYDIDDSKLEETFQIQLNGIKKVLEQEKVNAKEYTNLVKFQIDSMQEVKNYNFELRKFINILKNEG